MYDFGMTPTGLIVTAVQQGFKPNEGDEYDESAAFNGQTSQLFLDYCKNCWAGTGDCDPAKLDDSKTETIDWLYNADKTVDLRLFWTMCTADGGVTNYVDWHECRVKQISGVSELPVCYTTESLKYAQTGFFFSIVLEQLSNAISTKTRQTSFAYGGLANYSLTFGWTSEVCLTFVLAYIPPLNVGLGTRDVMFLHYGWPAALFSIYLLIHDEIRKYLIKNVKRTPGKPNNWWQRNTSW